MPLINRDKDIGEQREDFSVNLGAVATGVTRCVLIAPYSSEVSAIAVAGRGISGTPTAQFSINRFVVGSSLTNSGTAGFTSLSVQDYGTSGFQSVVQAASGSTTIQMNKGDALIYVSAGSNAAMAEVELMVSLKCLQDIKNQFGV